jgi:hypothetical protein
VGDGGPANDTVGTHGSGHAHHGGEQRSRQTLPLQFLGQRCSATRAGPSGRGKHDPVYARLLQLPGDLAGELAGA